MLVNTLTELSPRDDKEIVRLGSGDSPMWIDETYTTSVLNAIGYVKTIVLSTFPHCLIVENAPPIKHPHTGLGDGVCSFSFCRLRQIKSHDIGCILFGDLLANQVIRKERQGGCLKWEVKGSVGFISSCTSPLFTFRLSKPKTVGIQMLLVIQPLKKYLTEHESETLSTCHDKHLASSQDAQWKLSKTASLPEGKCILLLYLILLSTV